MTATSKRETRRRRHINEAMVVACSVSSRPTGSQLPMMPARAPHQSDPALIVIAETAEFGSLAIRSGFPPEGAMKKIRASNTTGPLRRIRVPPRAYLQKARRVYVQRPSARELHVANQRDGVGTAQDDIPAPAAAHAGDEGRRRAEDIEIRDA